MDVEKNKSTLLYSFLYLLLLYLGVRLLPIDDWISVDWLAFLVKDLLLLLVLLFALYDLRKERFFKGTRYFSSALIWLFPLLIGCFSNFLYVAFFGYENTVAIDPLSLSFQVVSNLFSVFIEEILFRFVLLTYFYLLFMNKKGQKTLTVLLSATAFSLMHAVNFFGNNPFAVLLQLGYAFVLGILLGCVALFFETPFIPYIGHFFFNFFNNVLFVSLFEIDMTTLSYILFSLGIALVLFLYLIFILFAIKRVHKKDTSCFMDSSIDVSHRKETNE